MSVRLNIFLISFFLITTTISIFPKPAIAQTCPATVVVDNFKCGDPNVNDYCDPNPVPIGSQSTQSCSWNGNTCMSNNGICSSNDSCSYQKILGFGFCRCTNSSVNCSNPNPPSGCFLPGTIVNGSGGGKKIDLMDMNTYYNKKILLAKKLLRRKIFNP